MPPQNEILTILPLPLPLHELHPAHNVHPDIRNRLVNAFIESDHSKRKFAKRSLIQLAEFQITVTGTKRAPTVISGWSMLHALKLYGVDEQIPCIAKWKLSKSRIRELSYLDFFFRPQIERHDEIALRIKAILMNERINKPELKELFSVDASIPKDFFDLPVHKGKRLENDLKNEDDSVRSLISKAEKPLGTKDVHSSKEPSASVGAKQPAHSHSAEGGQFHIEEKTDIPPWESVPEPDEPW